MKLILLRRALAVFSLVAVSAAPAGGQQPLQHPTRADLNGEWTGPLELDGGTQSVSLVFQLSDTAFAGVAYAAGRRFGDMEGGTLSGDTVKFHVDYLAFTGVITGKTMRIALIVYNGSTRNFVVTKKETDKGGLEVRRE